MKKGVNVSTTNDTEPLLNATTILNYLKLWKKFTTQVT